MATHRNAVVYRKKIPHYELTAEEVSYLLEDYEQGGRIFTLACFCRPYKPQKLKDALAAVAKDVKITGGLVPELDFRPYQDFVSDVFLRVQVYLDDQRVPMESDDPESHRSFFDSNPALKERLFLEGIHAGQNDPDFSSNGEKVMFLLEESERRIRTQRRLFSPESEKEEWIKASHVIRSETESDYHRYRKAVRREIKGKRNKSRVSININRDVIAGLYDSMVKSVSGFLVKGKLCRESNRADWLPLIPLDEKLLVMDIAMERTALKNV